jgi:hypothetical protein
MWACDDGSVDDYIVNQSQGEPPNMKKFLSMMLGLSLVLGAASMAFGEETKDTTKKEKTKKSKKAKKTDTSATK